MKTINIPVIFLMVVLSFIVIFHGCKKDFSRQPLVVTDRVDKALSQAYGKIVDAGTREINDYGFCWDTLSITPDLRATTLKLGKRSSTGPFQSQLSGLKPATTYHLRAFLMNDAGVIYGKLVDFTTPNLPIVTTSDVSEIGTSSAKCGGSITSDGGSPITTRGVCISTTQHPDISGNHTLDGPGTGDFISSPTGLIPSTQYYVRAYATSIYGTAYGSEMTFTSRNVASPVVTTSIATSITQSTAQCGGEVVSDGGASVTERGVCYSTNPSPTTSGPKTSDGSGTGAFISNINGLSANTTYYVCAYAINSAGTSYGSEVSFKTQSSAGLATVSTTSITNFTSTTATGGGNVTSDGGAAVTARGVCWSTSSNPTISNSHTSNGTGTGAFTSSLTGLASNTLYHIRAYATNSVGTSYGSDLTFTTLANSVIPTVTTTAATNITQATATSGGNVTSDGGAAVTARGVCWGTSSNPTISSSHTSNGTGTGIFASSLTGLAVSTLYHIRAYATNSTGTAYGNEVSLTTSSTSFYIGQSYGGGIIFYIDGSNLHGLIAAPFDQTESGYFGVNWGCYGTNISGTSTNIGAGQANTNAIINGCSEIGIAARICDDLVLNGYSDWFLPSKDELNQIFLHKNILGSFVDHFYWSSSNVDQYYAWAQALNNGATGYGVKNESFEIGYVRAIRAF